MVPSEPPVHALKLTTTTVLSADSVSLESLESNAETAHQHGRLEEALALYQSALHQTPRSPRLLSKLGNLQQDLGRPDTALACYEQSLLIEPMQSNTQRNIAILYSARNEPLRALEHLELAQQATPHPLNFVLGTTLLPIIYESAEQVKYWRGRLIDRLEHLVQSGITIDTTQTMIPTSFYFAYQGEKRSTADGAACEGVSGRAKL